MEDIERDAMFNKAQDELFARIFGNAPKVEQPEVEVAVIDSNFENGASWMDESRTTSNNDNTGWDEINKRGHEGNGYYEMGKRFTPRKRTKHLRWKPEAEVA